MNFLITKIFLFIFVKAVKYECLNGMILGDKGSISYCGRLIWIICCSVAVKEIFEDQGILNVYGLTEKKFLKNIETLGLDW